MRRATAAFALVGAMSIAPSSVVGAPPITGAATASAEAERLDVPTSSPTALGVLASIRVESEQPTGYDRSLFPHWTSQGNGCDTRDRVLIGESLTLAQVQYPGCAVVAGDWFSVYDGFVTDSPTGLDVDHVVALKEAWDSGAHSWSPQRRAAFANDLTDDRSLVAVSASSNRSKGDRDPSNWLPPRSAAICPYLSDWVAVKARWSLSMDPSEYGRIRNVLTARCPGQPIDDWTPPVVPEPPDRGDCDPSYPTVCIPPAPPDLDCGDIPDRDFVVLPPDPHRFDGNNDGIGCSS